MVLNNAKLEVSPQAFKAVSELVYREAAIVLNPGKEYLVSSRLASVVKNAELDGIDGLVAAIAKGGALAIKLTKEVVDALTTNETSFFRDNQPFKVLAETVLPDLMPKRKPLRSIKIWCAACSTGQEPYSICMTINDKLPELKEWRLQVLGTDISPTALAQSKSGLYSQTEVNRGLPITSLTKYFKKVERSWQISDEIMRMTSFREMNLTKDWPPMPKMDVIFFRNVLIYFDTDTKTELFKKIAGQLAPDGYLFLGSAESPNKYSEAFVRLDIPRSGCFQLKQS